MLVILESCWVSCMVCFVYESVALFLISEGCGMDLGLSQDAVSTSKYYPVLLGKQ